MTLFFRSLALSAFFACAAAAGDGKWVPYGKADITQSGDVWKVTFDPGLSGIWRHQATEPGIYEMRMEIRGSGVVYAAVQAPKGDWANSRYPGIQLITGEWQPFAYQTWVGAPEAHFAVLMRNGRNGKDSHAAEIRGLTVRRLPAEALPDMDVPPAAFMAETWRFGTAKTVAPDDSAGVHVRGKHNYQLAEFPVPMTSRPLFIGLRVKKSEGNQAVLILDSMGRALEKIPLTSAEDDAWRTVTAGPFHAGRTDGRLLARVVGDAQTWVHLEYAVFATEASAAARPPQLSPPRGGQAAAGRAVKPPVIDGAFDDDAWRHSVELAPFVLAGGMAAEEPGSARFAYDGEHLYAAFRGQSLALLKESNMRGSFLQKAVENDDPEIFRDDVFLLALRPEGGEHFYDIAVNGNGVVNDARMRPPDLWLARDAGWNSGAKVAVGLDMDKGEWRVEMALPWKAMGVDPRQTRSFEFMAARIEKRLGERSSWSPVEFGFHDPGCFGRLTLVERAPGVENLRIPAFHAGENTLEAAMETPRDMRLSAIQELRYPDGGPTARFEADIPAGARELQAPLFLERDGEFTYGYTLRDRATLEIYAQSPAYPSRPEFSVLTVEGDAGAWVNGRPAAGAGRTRLSRGVNQLAVRLEEGRNAAFVLSDARYAPDATWLYAPDAPEGWTARDFDDAGWRAAGADAGAPGHYRKKMFLDVTTTWPNWDRLHLLPGIPQILQFFPGGLPGVAMPEGYRVVFDLPAGVECLGASGYYGRQPGCRVEELAPPESAPESARRRYAVFAPRVEPEEEYRMQYRGIVVLLAAREDRGPGDDEIRFHAEHPAGGAAEFPQRLPVRVMAPLTAEPPSRIPILVWDIWQHALDDKALTHAHFGAYPRAGINMAGSIAPPGSGLRLLRGIQFGAWSVDLQPFLTRHPDMALLHLDGKRSGNLMCPTAMRTPEGAAGFVEAFARWYESHRADMVDWDYEKGAWEGNFACYCGACREAFARGAGLAAVPESAAVLRQRHANAWISFVCGHFAHAVGLYRQKLKELRPDALFAVYSGYASEHTREIYGVDWQMLAGKIDYAMAGYGLHGPALDAMRRALAGTPLINCQIIAPHDDVRRRGYPTTFTAAHALRSLIQTDGAMFFGNLLMDGRSFRGIAEAARLASRFEKALLDRKSAEGWKVAGSLPSEHVAIFRDGGDVVALLCNPDSDERVFTITPPPGAAANVCLDADGNAARPSGRLSPGAATALVFPGRAAP